MSLHKDKSHDQSLCRTSAAAHVAPGGEPAPVAYFVRELVIGLTAFLTLVDLFRHSGNPAVARSPLPGDAGRHGVCRQCEHHGYGGLPSRRRPVLASHRSQIRNRGQLGAAGDSDGAAGGRSRWWGPASRSSPRSSSWWHWHVHHAVLAPAHGEAALRDLQDPHRPLAAALAPKSSWRPTLSRRLPSSPPSRVWPCLPCSCSSAPS